MPENNGSRAGAQTIRAPLFVAGAWRGWRWTGEHWDTLEEGLGPRGRTGQGKGPGGAGPVPETQIALIISQGCEGK